MAFVVCPLGNEYPVAPDRASFTGCILESSIHGRYMHAIIFVRPFTKSAAAWDTSRYSPNFLSKHQYTVTIRNIITFVSPNLEQLTKKELKIPPVISLKNCKNNSGSIKILMISPNIYS